MLETFKFYRRNLFKLLNLYLRKKNGFITDIYFQARGGMHKNDILVEKIRIDLPNGKEGIICLHDVDSFIGRMGYGLKYDILGYVDVKPIRNCTFLEFLKLYGRTILDGRDI